MPTGAEQGQICRPCRLRICKLVGCLGDHFLLGSTYEKKNRLNTPIKAHSLMIHLPSFSLPLTRLCKGGQASHRWHGGDTKATEAILQLHPPKPMLGEILTGLEGDSPWTGPFGAFPSVLFRWESGKLRQGWRVCKAQRRGHSQTASNPSSEDTQYFRFDRI